MDKKVLVFTIGLMLLISGAVTYTLLSPKNTIIQEQADEKTPSPKTQPQSSPTPQPSYGNYIDYSEANVASTTGTKILFFHAPWCPQCRELEASIKKDGIPSGVTIFKVDYDSNQTLRQKYGVTIQTTFVKIDAAGNKLASYVAYETPQFSSVQRALLP